ncbi:S41 family peptidase, partial [Robinsoniella sp.]
ELTMKRQKIKVDTIRYQMLPDKVGYIAISEFDEVTVDQFKNAIDDLQKQGMEKVVYDLRNCPGGLLDSVVSMLDYILPDGLIVYTEDKNGTRLDEISGADGHEVKLPTVVLMNGNSASAAEVFASAIRDYKWGTLAGTTSFGKGIVQNLIPLEDGTAVKLTISSYFTKSGYSIQGKGLEPDVVIEADEEQAAEANIALEKDKQLQETLKIFYKLDKKQAD